MSCPKISIIVPVYQGGRFLARCLDSLLAQSFGGWECILVDDGSTDGSGAVCDGYRGRDDRFRVIHRPNGGASAARNSGVEAARGEWVQFADCDDELEPGYCSALLAASEGAELVIAGYTVLKDGGSARFVPDVDALLKTPEELCRRFDGLYFRMLLNSPCNKLYRREKLAARFPEGVAMGEDFLFNMACLSGTERVALLRNAGYLYHQDNAASATGSFSYNTPELMLEYCRSALPVLERGGDRELARSVYDRIVFHSLCNNLNVAARAGTPLLTRIEEYTACPEVRRAVRDAYVSDFPRSKRLVQKLLQKDMKRAVALGLRVFGR